jgi:hypothetical protein
VAHRSRLVDLRTRQEQHVARDNGRHRDLPATVNGEGVPAVGVLEAAVTAHHDVSGEDVHDRSVIRGDADGQFRAAGQPAR